jgi:hypothetical protein
MFIVTEKARARDRKWDGFGVIEDKEWKFEDIAKL